MAKSVKTNRFYVVLGVIALAGGAAIFWSRGDRGAQSGTLKPLEGSSAGAEAMPGYVVGSDSAKLEVLEYADFQCPACRMFTIITKPDVDERLVKPGLIRWRFRDRPLDGHAKSPVAHHAAACAGEQGKFWSMHDQLYLNQSDWVGGGTEKKIRSYAEKAGVDLAKYDECMKSQRYRARLAASAEQATAQGITSTPTFVFGPRMVSGALAYDALKAIVDSILGQKKAA